MYAESIHPELEYILIDLDAKAEEAKEIAKEKGIGACFELAAPIFPVVEPKHYKIICTLAGRKLSLPSILSDIEVAIKDGSLITAELNKLRGTDTTCIFRIDLNIIPIGLLGRGGSVIAEISGPSSGNKDTTFKYNMSSHQYQFFELPCREDVPYKYTINSYRSDNTYSETLCDTTLFVDCSCNDACNMLNNLVDMGGYDKKDNRTHMPDKPAVLHKKIRWNRNNQECRF